MLPHFRHGLPVVTLFNHLDAYGYYLSREDENHLYQNWGHHGDRSLYWAGDHKLAFVSAPVKDIDLFRSQWNYTHTRMLAPERPTNNLAFDILREPRLLNALHEHAGAERAVQLIPFSTTSDIHQFAQVLRTEHGLHVELPESPAPDNLWIRDHIDSKSGFRHLVLQWLDDPSLLPFGVICHEKKQAQQAVSSLLKRGVPCVVKADLGVSGLGHLVFKPEENWSPEAILRLISDDIFFREELIIVEECIPSSNQISPSPEVFVPPLGTGEPFITYHTQQLLYDFGHFGGVLISRELAGTAWYPVLSDCCLKIGRELQRLGYVGIFDMDALIADDGRIYLLEVNARRTGGTHVHELAIHLLGENYLQEYMLLSDSSLPCPGVTTAADLIDQLSALLFPIHGEPFGLVITDSPRLERQKFGGVFIGRTMPELLRLKQSVLDHLLKVNLKEAVR